MAFTFPTHAAGQRILATDINGIQNAINVHDASTANVHGIADTADLLTGTDNLASVADAAVAIDNLTLTEQLDLPTKAAAATVVYTAPETFSVPNGTVNQVWNSYTVPACDYAILRSVWIHMDFLNTVGNTIRSTVLVTIGDTFPYRLLDLIAVTTNEQDALVEPKMVLHEGDTIKNYVTQQDAASKALTSLIVVEVYGG